MIGPAVVTDDYRQFYRSLQMLDISGGGDCPEMALTGEDAGPSSCGLLLSRHQAVTCLLHALLHAATRRLIEERSPTSTDRSFRHGAHIIRWVIRDKSSSSKH